MIPLRRYGEIPSGGGDGGGGDDVVTIG